MATYLIGDVHGCYDELIALLHKVEFTPGKDTLWLTGDLVASRDPRRILAMGFSVVRLTGGALADPLALHPGDRVEIETHSRTFEAQIDKIKSI